MAEAQELLAGAGGPVCVGRPGRLELGEEGLHLRSAARHIRSVWLLLLLLATTGVY